MHKQLLLLRHGKSDWRVDVDDFDRPLKKRGKLGAKRIGIWLKDRQLIPDYIVSSPAERAKATAKRLSKAIELDTRSIHYDPRLYEAGLGDLKAVLSDCPAGAERVLLVGHNPGLEQLLLYLQAGTLAPPKDGKLLATATLAMLNMPDDWTKLANGAAQLVSLIRASSLS
ncbi:histidine phosphatase family protein [Methylomarinum sp. Ch1-1]|uniref:Histidine phosphatase family protein n=1 Tax=Methylomarinum roseum TaxID=3067653 RepID=A0AAU7NQB8_9GAMM|nr:histidine phosphatase family protein [Methylomarinum sp. Ch1-1]MDP4520905.1 histidine phosphatase family protein [Methylomarinum sp. Ch1-1]